MAQDYQKLWSCVGSAGAINPPDLTKIILSGSVAQLGPGEPVVVDPGRLAAESIVTGTHTITAVIRYGVVPVDGVYLVGGPFPPDPNHPDRSFIALRLRYRDGSGHVLAKLIQVNIDSGAEYTMTEFDSGTANSDGFRVWESEAMELTLDFVANAYYVEVTLSATERLASVLPSPPAVSVVQLYLESDTDPNSGDRPARRNRR